MTIYKQFDKNGNIVIYKIWCRNDNRKSIEPVDVLPFAEAGLNEEQIIELLRKNRVHVLTSSERKAIDFMNDTSETITLTKNELEFAVKHGLNYDDLVKFRDTIRFIKQFKINVD